MVKTRQIILGACVLIILVFLFTLSTKISACHAPIFLGIYDSPDSTLSSFIQTYGGLPKTNTDLAHVQDRSAPVRIHPVMHWEVNSTQVHRPFSLWHAIRDDDPTYRISADIQVRYADGSESRLRWRSWRYGLAVCPIVVGMGDGPPGSIGVIALR